MNFVVIIVILSLSLGMVTASLQQSIVDHDCTVVSFRFELSVEKRVLDELTLNSSGR